MNYGEDELLKQLMAQGGQMPARPQYSGGFKAQQGLQGLMGNRDLAMALLANSGASPQKRGFGEILGTSAIQADQMKQGRADDEFKRQYMQAQMQNNQAKSQFGAISPDKFTPESISKFEQTQKYSDLVQAPIQRESIDSAQIRNYQFRQSLKTDEERRIFDDIQRQNYDVSTVGGGVGVARKGPQPTFAPLSTPQQEVTFAAQKKAAEGEAGAIGKGMGDIQVGVQTKGANAKTVLGMLDEADKLIDSSTGSALGAGRDKVAGVFGQATPGAQASAQLQVIQAGLMTNMPRMEGPQSDADVALYRQAAGQIGDPNVPNAIKKAALATVRRLQEKYVERAGLSQKSSNAPSVGTVKGGYRFKGGNPADKNSWEPVK